MALDSSVIVTAMIQNFTSKGLNPSDDQKADMQRIADSIVTMIIEGLTITTLNPTGLSDSSGPVTGTLLYTIS